MIVYIAGPYSPTFDKTTEQNIKAAGEMAKLCWMNGLTAICPQMNTAHFDGVADAETFYIGDLEILERCDALILMPNWEESFGARMEKIYARKIGIPIYHSVEDCLNNYESLGGELDD